MKSRILYLVGLSVVILCGATVQAATVDAKAFSVSGEVEYAAPRSVKFQPLEKGTILPVGSTIRTGDDGSAVIATTPGTAIEVAADTTLKINALAFAKSGDEVIQRQAHLELKSGAVSALIDPKTPTVTDFQIITPQGAAAARGTYYAVVVKDGKAYVSVAHGKVAAIAN